MDLPRGERNEIFNVLRDEGLDLAESHRSEDELSFAIVHDRTRSKFTIYEADRLGKFEIDVILAGFYYDHTGDYYWGQLLAELKDWIVKVKFEHDGREAPG